MTSDATLRAESVAPTQLAPARASEAPTEARVEPDPAASDETTGGSSTAQELPVTTTGENPEPTTSSSAGSDGTTGTEGSSGTSDAGTSGSTGDGSSSGAGTTAPATGSSSSTTEGSAEVSSGTEGVVIFDMGVVPDAPMVEEPMFDCSTIPELPIVASVARTIPGGEDLEFDALGNLIVAAKTPQRIGCNKILQSGILALPVWLRAL